MAETQSESYEVITNAAAGVTSAALLLGTDSKTFQAKGTTTAGAGTATIIDDNYRILYNYLKE